MGSFSGLGIGLSFVFGCILMGLVAELYYLLWWKKRSPFPTTTRARAAIEAHLSRFLLCWKTRRPFDHTNSGSSSMELTTSATAPDPDLEIGKLVGKKEEDDNDNDDDDDDGGIENLGGPPRFLFTITEENREDLESEDGKSRKGSRASRSLSDLVLVGNGTPFLTPLSSPTATFLDHGSSLMMSEAEIQRLRSSPPPKLKFLKDAEDKLLRRLVMMEQEQEQRKRELAKVLPLSSSPC